MREEEITPKNFFWHLPKLKNIHCLFNSFSNNETSLISKNFVKIFDVFFLFNFSMYAPSRWMNYEWTHVLRTFSNNKFKITRKQSVTSKFKKKNNVTGNKKQKVLKIFKIN